MKARGLILLIIGILGSVTYYIMKKRPKEKKEKIYDIESFRGCQMVFTGYVPGVDGSQNLEILY